MSAKLFRAFLGTSALATLCASWGCVADRPSRNGVFNENQYVRKDFLIRRADTTTPDNGWIMKATILKTSTPNPLGGFDIATGFSNTGSLVRFDVTSDKLRVINVRELQNFDPKTDIGKQDSRQPEVVNAWPITNVDLKYRINLDGEKTNFYEENQELSWDVRQWVKVNFAKNDMSDLAPLGAQAILDACVDQANSTVTLVPNSFLVDEKNDYMQWKVDMTFPIKFGDAACVEAYGDSGRQFQVFQRQSVSMTMMYSFVRAVPSEQITYAPLEIAEKDPIRKKYGTIDYIPMARDPDTGLLAARQLAYRYDPSKPFITYVFAPGFPDTYKKVFTDPNGLVDQTNKLMTAAGATTRLRVLNFDDAELAAKSADGKTAPEFGDVRYNWLRWVDDIDTQSTSTLAFTQPCFDPRTGEAICTDMVFYGFELLNRVKARLDFYLKSIGAFPQLQDPNNPDSEWVDPGACQDGDVMPLVAKSDDPKADTVAARNSHSTLYAKMQEYLQRPISKFGNLSPADFVVKQDDDFYKAFFQIIPYQIYRDPAANVFVVPEGGTGAYGPEAMLDRARKEASFHALAAQLDKGVEPFDITPGAGAIQRAGEFLDTLKSLTVNHREYDFAKKYFNKSRFLFADDYSMYNYIDVFQRDARHCINGKWETKTQYVQNLTDSYHALTIWHEFGHALGLDHNFMASVDRPNFPHYKDGAGRDHVGMYQSSVMEYNATPDRVFWKTSLPDDPKETGVAGWGPYDRAAIAFIYANAQNKDDKRGAACAPATACTVSGQSKPADPTFKAPWKDPAGVNGDGSERQFLYCNGDHVKFTPFCRPFDFGTTPSEIVAAAIDDYEWQYKWRNFRQYRKFWSAASYVDGPATLITDIRKFISQWTYDWQAGEVQDTLRRIGVKPPANTPANTYYDQLTNKFNLDISTANMMVAAFHKAVIQQSSGERPFKTIFDNYYGDVAQQGIFLDKLLAAQSWLALWQTDNYDPNQAQGAYIASYSDNMGDSSYDTAAEDVVDSMVGGQYDVYTYFKPLAVTMFSQATHDVNFSGRIDQRDWVGGHVFYRERDFLDYFRGIAVQRNTYGCEEPHTLETCLYDPRAKRYNAADEMHSDDYNEFVGPDGRRWAWVYVMDRNAWIAVDRDRNTASYVIVRNYNALVVHGEVDDQRPFYVQLQIKYFLDAYNQYN